MKLLLFAEFRQHLVQTHWRNHSLPPNGLDQAAFLLFVGIIVASLLLLSRHCETRPNHIARHANMVVLFLSLVFIFLTFHEGDKNYIHPVIDGILDLSAVCSYLALDLFFRPPYLAAWAFAYALVYWVVARSGRERLILRFTAVFAGLYLVLCLRELPASQAAASDLLIVDVFGVATLLGLSIAKRPLRLGWVTIFIGGWIGAAWCLLATTSSDIASPAPYFISYLAFIVAVVLGAGLVASRGGFMQPWSWITPFLCVTLVLLGNNHYPDASSLNQILNMAMSAPRYIVGETFLAVLVLLLGSAWWWWRPKTPLWLLDFICICLVLLALVDLRLSQIMGVRLDWNVIAFGHSPKMMWRMAQPYLVSLVLATVFVCTLYGVGIRLLRKRVPSELRYTTASLGPGWYFAITLTVLLAAVGWIRVKPDKVLGQSVLQVAASSPAMRRISHPAMSPKEFQAEARSLGLAWGEPLTLGEGRSTTQPMNVVFILLESTYNKHLSLFGGKHDTQPLLSRYRDRMEIFPNFFANYMGSIHARFACFTGLYPVQDYYSFTLKRVPVKSMFEVMNEQGYQCSMFYSSYFDYTCFRDFLVGRGLDELYDADTMPGAAEAERISWGLHEGDTLDAIKEEIGQRAVRQSPFFLTYIPACPHYPYDSVPPEFQKYKLEEYRNLTPLYRNSLLYMDWIVSGIVEELESNGLLDRTLIVITGDHGEMLGEEDGKIGHGWAVTPELSNVPLILIKPGQNGFEINPTIGSHVDLLPTIADLTGVPLPIGELYQGRSLYRPLPEGRSIYINSHQQYGVIQGDRLICGDRAASSPCKTQFESWLITNDGSLTRFEPVSTPHSNPPDIGAFDRFQSGILSDYWSLRDRPGRAVISHNPERSEDESLGLPAPVSMAKWLQQ